jgi:hypothetical protein
MFSCSGAGLLDEDNVLAVIDVFMRLSHGADAREGQLVLPRLQHVVIGVDSVADEPGPSRPQDQHSHSDGHGLRGDRVFRATLEGRTRQRA